MHHGETPALSQEQVATLLWLQQHLREQGVRDRRWLAGSRAIPAAQPHPTWGQLFLVRRVRLLCDGTSLYGQDRVPTGT